MMLCDRNAAYFNLGNIKHWPLEREAFYPFGNLGRQGAKLFIQMTKSSADINYNKKGDCVERLFLFLSNCKGLQKTRAKIHRYIYI
jgi:hypothetical protein